MFFLSTSQIKLEVLQHESGFTSPKMLCESSDNQTGIIKVCSILRLGLREDDMLSAEHRGRKDIRVMEMARANKYIL